MTADPLYHTRPAGPLMARLFYTFPLADGTNVSYPRQEAPMRQPDAHAQLDALRREFVDEAAALRELLHLAAERERSIMLLWEQIAELETAQRGCPPAADGEAG